MFHFLSNDSTSPFHNAFEDNRYCIPHRNVALRVLVSHEIAVVSENVVKWGVVGIVRKYQFGEQCVPREQFSKDSLSAIAGNVQGERYTHEE